MGGPGAQLDAEDRIRARRTCVGCRAVRSPGRLWRVACAEGGGLTLDRRAPGRGAWLCRSSPSCLQLAIRRNAFARALRSAVSADALAELAAALVAREARGSCG